MDILPIDHPLWLPSRVVAQIMSLNYRTVIRFAQKYEWEAKRVGYLNTWYINWRSVEGWMQKGGVDRRS